MITDFSTAIETGPVDLIYHDGSRRVWKRHVTRVTDVRLTAIGLVDFGYMSIDKTWTELIPAPPRPSRWARLRRLVGRLCPR